MACLNMLNTNEQQISYSSSSSCTSMGPRISFSNDFAESKQPTNNYREAPVSSDFEFSVPNHNMNSADELFFKGKMVPLKENYSLKTTTLRDELLAGDDDVLPRIPKNSGWWKEKLGLRRGHMSMGNKKGDGNDQNGGLETIDEGNKAVFGHQVYANMTGERGLVL